VPPYILKSKVTLDIFNEKLKKCYMVYENILSYNEDKGTKVPNSARKSRKQPF